MDYIIDLTRQEDLILYVHPIGGSGGTFVAKQKIFTKDNARSFGSWLARRYKDVPNIVWMDGFDLPPWEYRDVAEELAVGLREGDGGAHLIAYDPGGGSSSDYFQQEKWFAFNHIQTGNDYWRSHPTVLADYCLLPAKPTVMGEGAYEAGVEYRSGPITPLIVRKEAYWSYLGGGFHTYGHNDVWRKNQNWRHSLDSPGAQQMGVLKKIFTSRKWSHLVPDQSIFVLGANSDLNLNAAARSTEGDTVMAYLSGRNPVTIDMTRITASRTVRATWVNPQTGEQTAIGVFANLRTRLFTMPPSFEDAVLLLDAVPEGKS